jgi:hypothetical protein
MEAVLDKMAIAGLKRFQVNLSAAQANLEKSDGQYMLWQWQKKAARPGARPDAWGGSPLPAWRGGRRWLVKEERTDHGHYHHFQRLL